MSLTSIIKDTLFNSRNKINSKRISYFELDYPELYEQVLEETSFLPEGVLINERIFCIINSITSFPVCPMCNTNKRSFILYRGYKQTCGHPKCGALLRHSLARKQKVEKLI